MQDGSVYNTIQKIKIYIKLKNEHSFFYFSSPLVESTWSVFFSFHFDRSKIPVFLSQHLKTDIISFVNIYNENEI